MTTYWHGGRKGLARGGHVLPPSTTGARRTLADYGTVAAGLARRDRVYVTTDKRAAILYAAGIPGGGCVYEVEPIGAMVPDPDCSKPGLSWECESALIVGIYPISKRTARMARTALINA